MAPQLQAYKEENTKLKEDLTTLHKAVVSNSAEDEIPNVLTKQVSALSEENHKHRQEIVRWVGTICTSGNRMEI